VLETGVEVRLGAELDDLLEVRVVNVGVDAKEAPEDGLDDVLEVPREGSAWRKGLYVLAGALRCGLISTKSRVKSVPAGVVARSVMVRG
jgi:hypothetical protein